MSKIRVYNQALSSEFCQNMIGMFESNDFCSKTKHPGGDLSYKIDCDDKPIWVKMRNMLRDSRDHFMASYFVEFPEYQCEIKCGGYTISRYNPTSIATEFYGVAEKLSAVWFLNSIDIGGYIILDEAGELVEVKPQIGRLIIFPNDTVHLSRQIVGTTSKYLVINNISEMETPA